MRSLSAWWRQRLGLIRTLWIYRRPGRQRGLAGLYRPMVGANDLVFDIGAHVGDRTRCFRALGARVIALEPQPALMDLLRRFHGADDQVVLLPLAVGDRAGKARLALSRSHPSVASLSQGWREEVKRGHGGFDQVQWDDSIEVAVTTLDCLISQYGLPDFCKIDVEGHEPAVLAGLSVALPALSVEFVRGTLPRTLACLHRLSSLGDYTYNVVAGEKRTMHFDQWLSAEAVHRWFEDGADGLASGDLYARLRPD